MGMSTLLQWNYRGFKANIDEIELLIHRFNRLLLCLQEIYIKYVDTSFFIKYSFYNKIGNVTENRASGGVTSLVTSESVLIHMLTCHRPTLPRTGFATGSTEYCLCKFRQFGNFRIPFHTHAHFSSPETVTDSVCRWLSQAFSLHL